MKPLTPKMQKKMENAMNDPEFKKKFIESMDLFPALARNIDILENQIIVVQKNQVEFETYLKTILERMDQVLIKLSAIENETKA